MKKTLTTILVLLISMLSQAQTKQTGWVTELNSNKTALPGVQVTFYGASPTKSMNDGKFNLNFREKKLGDVITYNDIYKKGYEIVNQKELQTAKLSKTNLKIILAVARKITHLKAQYYDISIKALTAGHDRKIRQLKKQLGENSEKFAIEKRKLKEELENAKEHAHKLAEQFEYDSAGILYQQLWLLDTTNIENTSDYADCIY